MFSFFKKLTGPSDTQEHAGHSGGHSHRGGCCGGGGHAHEEHDGDTDATSAADRESSASASGPAAGENQHVHT
jgi:hypothetical protein